MLLPDDGPAAQMAMVALPQQIREHAATVGRLAQDVEQTHAAARHVVLDHGAYGLMCAVMPAAVMPIQGRIVAAMRSAAEAVQATGDALYRVADTFEDVDRAAANRLDAVVPDMGGL